MCYSDNTSYPGDSFFCQEVVRAGGFNAFSELIAIPHLEPDDCVLERNLQNQIALDHVQNYDP